MNRKTKVLGAGLAALLVIGLVATAHSAIQGKGEGLKGRGMRKGFGPLAMAGSLGLPENATRQQIKDAVWDKRLADLGLTRESTIGEYVDAMEANMLERHNEMLEELGLPEDATPEQVHEAMEERRGQKPFKGQRRGCGLIPDSQGE